MAAVAFRVLGFGSVVAALIGACSSGDETAVEPATTGSGQGASSSVGNGSGATGTGGMAEPCPHEGPDVLDPSTLMPCPMCAGGAHCVPATLIPPEYADQLGDCDADNKCVPDDFIKTGGNFIPDTCTSNAGNEG